MNRFVWICALALGSLLLTREASATEDLSSAVEDFTYPGAEQIFKEYGIRLLSGDGRIRFAPNCAGSEDDLIRVYTSPSGATHCFSIHGSSGYVKIELPGVYLIKNASKPLTATATFQGKTETTTIAPKQHGPIGGGSPTHTLIELKMSGKDDVLPGSPAPLPFVAKIDVAGRGCSGVLVAPQWLVTTNTCIAEDGQVVAGPPPVPITVVVGRNDLRGLGGHAVEVVQLLPRTDRDLTMLKLAKPITDITPLRVSASTPFPGERLQVLGYGRTDKDWVGERVQVRTMTVTRSERTSLELARSSDAGLGVCKGDAGGPSVRQIKGRFELVGIHRASSHGGCIGFDAAGDGASDVRTDDIAAWISQSTGLSRIEQRFGATGQLLSSDGGRYPRAIRLESSGSASGRILVSVATPENPSGQAALYESLNDGSSFSKIGVITVPDAAGGGVCCGTLFELPQQVGGLPRGTLLWAAAVGSEQRDRRMSIQIWRSTDVGRTWTYLSSAHVAPNTGGLWEPALSVDADGRLVCHFSDETDQPVHSQALRRTVSNDGLSWSPSRDTVVAAQAGLRPGAATVRRLPGGSYIMVYELCSRDGSQDCAAHLRTSPDGDDWGAPSDLGRRIVAADGSYFTSTPTVTWLDNRTPNGRLLLVGQTLRNQDGSVAAGDGKTILVNTEKGLGGWYAIPAPVSVRSPVVDHCNNYDPTLVASLDGTRALQITTTHASDGICRAYFATGSTTVSQQATGISSGKIYRLANVMSRHCLEVAGNSKERSAMMQQGDCLASSAQNFVFTATGDGHFTLAGQNSKLCVAVGQSLKNPGANVLQWPCLGYADQAWKLENVGTGYYRIVNKNSGLCLDVAGGSTQPGGKVWQWTCNSQSSQVWYISDATNNSAPAVREAVSAAASDSAAARAAADAAVRAASAAAQASEAAARSR